MRKRLLSILLTLCMVLSLLPQVALAEEEVSYTYGGDISATGLDLSTAPNENKAYKAGNGVVLWQPGTNTVLMRDATIDTTGDACALTLKNDADVTIVADGTNVLRSNSDGIGQKQGDYPSSDYNVSTVIEGSGTLEVTSTSSKSWEAAIDLPYGPLTISGDVTVSPICQNDGLETPKGLSILDNASVTAPSNININTAFDKVNIDTTGTVTEFYSMSLGDLNYTNGDLKGLLVWIVNNDGGQNRSYSVHGNYTMTKDTTIRNYSGEDGLMVKEGATLTIPEGVTITVEDDTEDGVPQITNDGTIVNNGTIQFSNTATDAEILALAVGGTFKGSGTVKRGDKEVFPLNGDVYEVAANVTSTGLDLSTNAPTANTLYKAGNGYILWYPSSGTLSMQDAEISSASTALKLPGSAPKQVDITIVAEGDNSLISDNNYGISHVGGATLVQGNGKLNIQGKMNGISQQNGTLTITGNVTANAKGGDGYYDIYTSDMIISENASVTDLGSSAGIYSSGNITINTTGTVNVTEIKAIEVFDLKAGTLTGSWVWEGKENYYENEVNTVYGNVTVVGAKYINDVSQLKGLTIMQGATLTIDNSGMLTIEDIPEVDGVPKITNNGTIVNNGTIKFPEGTTSAEIEALNITGSGTIRIGDTDVAVIGGVMYPFGGDVSDVGVDFTVNAPTADTYYKAGRGYMLFSPSNGTLTLHNAQINVDLEKPLITLPKNNIKLVLEGENALTNSDGSKSYAPAIQQGEVLDIEGGPMSAVTPQAYTITVSGTGSLEISAENSEILPISTDGTFIVESGTIKSGDADAKCCGISTADFKMIGGSLEASFGITSFGNALIQGGTIFAPGNDSAFDCLGNFEMSGGTVTCGFSMFGGLLVGGGINKTGGTLNALVGTVEMNSTPYIDTLTPYGSAPMCTYYNDGTVDENQDLFLGGVGKTFNLKLNIPSGSTIAIPRGATLNLNSYMSGRTLSDYVANNGRLINNGSIVLPENSTADEVKAALAILKPTGTGIIVVPMGEMPNYYANSGDPMNSVNGLNLGKMETSGDGYTWVGNSTDGFTLTLDNLFVFWNNINLPENVPVTIVLEGNSVADKGIAFTHSGPYAAPCNLTIAGSGTLTLNGGISGGGSNGDAVTIKGGATVNVNDGINIGASGGQDGTLIVDGAGTSLNVTGQMGSGVYLDTLQLSDGAQMTVHSDEVGIFAHAGGVTIAGGSTLTAGCNYGVYIIDGNLSLDSTSKLVTNAAIAPFCVVDTTKTKADSVMASISNIPSGTQINSVHGTDEGYGYTYCSLVSTGGTLGVKDEANEPATLSGTVKGTVTFAASHNNGGDNNNGGGNGSGDDNNGGGSGSSGGGSSTNYTITATAGEGGSISPNGKVSVVSNGNKTFAITANNGYGVKDVLVDGVSIGAVTEYTFDEVTRAHTITASFEEIPEKNIDESNNKSVLYNDVKNSDWFKDAVGFVTEKGLMAGISEGKFGPNINIDRGMLVTILWRLEGQPSSLETASFTDVDQDDYYAKAVAWASENKIVEGYGNGHFGPKDTVTREQMAAILYRYSKFKSYDTTKGEMAVREFSDYANISNWALESVAWAVNTGLLSGTNDGKLNPQGFATRAQAASILMRYSENIKK